MKQDRTEHRSRGEHESRALPKCSTIINCEYYVKIPWADRFRVIGEILGTESIPPMRCPGNPDRYAVRMTIEAIGSAINAAGGAAHEFAGISVWFDRS